MKKKLCFASALLLLFLLTACGNGNSQEKTSSESEMPEKIIADLNVPEHADNGTSVSLRTTVSQGKEKVKDADDVQYEIWKNNEKENSKMVPAKNEKDGTYTAKHTFKEDGIYSVQVHVTARDMHTMPKKDIAIGDTAKTPEKSHHENQSDHQTEDFSMHFMKPDNVRKANKTALTVHLEKHGKPLEKADVRYEIWKEKEKKHDWTDAKETEAGAYEGSYSFQETGTYTVKIHVENEQGLHEHENHTIEVQ